MRIKSQVLNYYRAYILRDSFHLAITCWFRDGGDENLRLNYPLDSKSIVLDLGGFQGDFAEAINSRFGCKVYVFEPVREFYDSCLERFAGKSNIVCHPFGLGASDEVVDINLAGNASTVLDIGGTGQKESISIRSIVEFIQAEGIKHIDLIKINIEGAEFEVLPAIIESGLIEHVEYLQVQFHNFVPGAEEKRRAIRGALALTHRESWNYEFVWESWEKK